MCLGNAHFKKAQIMSIQKLYAKFLDSIFKSGFFCDSSCQHEGCHMKKNVRTVVWESHHVIDSVEAYIDQGCSRHLGRSSMVWSRQHYIHHL